MTFLLYRRPHAVRKGQSMMNAIRHAKKIRAIVMILIGAAFVISSSHVARADIFKWEYINPANPGEGKQPSTMLCPDGAGVDAVPGANLANRNLTMAYLIGADLGSYSDDYGYYET